VWRYALRTVFTETVAGVDVAQARFECFCESAV
jgi:hypothetical protein